MWMLSTPEIKSKTEKYRNWFLCNLAINALVHHGKKKRFLIVIIIVMC